MPPENGQGDHISRFDVVVVFDPRAGDTGGRHAAAMVRALAQAGHHVGALFWMGRGGADFAKIEAQTSELLTHARITRLSVAARIRTRLLIAIDLRLFLDPATRPVEIETKTRIVLVTRRFADTPAAAWNVLDNCREALGGKVTLAPVAPTMRDALAALVPDAVITGEDWIPVLAGDPSAPRDDATRRVSAPVLGYYRHGRNRPWPRKVGILKTWLPPHDLLSYRLFHPPGAWTDKLRAAYTPLVLHTRGETALAHFLAGCDFVVSTDDPADDPYPEELIRALDAGAVPLLTPHWRRHFYAAAAYAQPRDMADMAVDVFTNPVRYQDIRAAWGELRDFHFAPEAFAARVARVLGPEYPTPLVSSSTSRPAATILSLSTNGIGMGHLTRQLAIARRLPAHITPAFISFSHAAKVLRDFGYMVEFQPFHNQMRLNSGYWNLAMHDYLESACRFYRPSAFVLDANVPFPAIEDLRAHHPEIPFIWVRRAMWGDGRDLDALDKADLFDVVIEPGEIADRYDKGPTKTARQNVAAVSPLVLLNDAEMLPRDQATAELGLSAEALNVLVLPGGQNNFDTSTIWHKLFDEFARVPGLNVVFAEWAISDKEIHLPSFVQRIKGYPFSRWFRAFDFAVSAAGYNSFSELMAARLPTIFVPNEHPTMDRQDLRALFAQRHGMGLRLRADEAHLLREAVEAMCDPARRAAFSEAMAHLPAAQGAAQAADIVAMFAQSGRISADMLR